MEQIPLIDFNLSVWILAVFTYHKAYSIQGNKWAHSCLFYVYYPILIKYVKDLYMIIIDRLDS